MSGTRSDIEIPDTGLIQSGPEPVDQSEQVPREPSARELAMERIIANRERVMAEEMQGADEQIEQLPEHSLDYSDDRVDVDAPPPQRAEAPQRRRQVDTGQQPLVAIEIDGQILHATPDQVTELARMGAIAHREIGRFNAQQAQGWQQPQPQYQQPPQQPVGRGIVDDERIASAVRAIQYGDESAAGEALKGLISDVVQRQPDAVRVVEQRFAQAAMQQKLAADTAVISKEFPDIIQDKIRARAAAQEVESIRQWAAQTGQQFDDLLIYREAGNRVRASFGSAPEQRGRQSYQDGNLVVRRSVDEIDGRKRAAPRAMAQVIDRRSAAPQQERRQSPSDVVDMMRRSRNQTPLR